MAHGAQQRLHHAQGVHAGLLAVKVRLPQVRHSAVGCLELCRQYMCGRLYISI